MRKVPVFILPDVDKSSTPISELLRRHELYLSKFYNSSPNPEDKALVFITGIVDSIRADYEYLRPIILSHKHIPSFIFMLRLRKFIKASKLNISFVVAGTPLFPFLIALMLKSFSPSLKIQVAIHGEISSYLSRNLSGILKGIFLFIFLRFASAVRFVSDLQLKGFSNFVLKNRQRVFIVPVPIIQKTPKLNHKSRSIGFVGRVHQERGLSRWEEIAKMLPDIHKVVVGGGPILPKFQQDNNDFEFLGQLPPDEMEVGWEKIGLLLSTAPFESYGLAMREALLRNIPVVSARNAGSLDLETKFPQIFKTFETDDEAVRAIQQFLSGKIRNEYFDEYRKFFQHEQEVSLNQLADVWRELSL